MFPIILAHGIARFDILRQNIHDELHLPANPLEDKLNYFKNVKPFLHENGFPDVFITNVDFAGALDLRARELKRRTLEVLAETGAEKVHIIAHSMGGLDARMMIVDLEMAEKVATLTTIGTPHLGTVLADRMLAIGGNLLINQLRDTIDLEGARDLTTTACENFNRRARDAEAKNPVVYQTYSSYEEANDMFLPLLGSWAFIRAVEGRNDGLVPVGSQQWEKDLIASDGTSKRVRQHEFPLRADHLNQCGWWDLEEAAFSFFGGNPFQQKEDYERQIKNIYLEIANNLRNL